MMRVTVPSPSDSFCNRSRRAPECSTLSTCSSMTISWATGTTDMGGGAVVRVKSVVIQTSVKMIDLRINREFVG